MTMITAMISDFKSSEASKKNVQYFQRFHAETWHKSMLRKEILKCDKNSDTFHADEKIREWNRAFLRELDEKLISTSTLSN